MSEPATAAQTPSVPDDLKPATDYSSPAVVIVVTTLLAVAVSLHVRGMNGPEYWQWMWRRQPILRYALALAAAAVPFFAAQWLTMRGITRVSHALLVIMLSNILLQWVAAGIQTHPFSATPVVATITHSKCTSYCTVAQGMITREGLNLSQWLRDYPIAMDSYPLHARAKPPGIVLYYYLFFRLLGVSRYSVLAAGLVISILASLAIPGTYAMIRTLTGDRLAAFRGASFLALAPGMILLFPQFDQVYPVVACVLVILWALALRADRFFYSALMGIVLALICFFAYNLLVLGFFFAGCAATSIYYHGRARLGVVALHAGIALIAWAGFIQVMDWFIGFDSVATYRAASANTARGFMAMERDGMGRHWPQTIPFDLTDFAMAAGWIGVLLAGFYLFRGGRREMPYLLAFLAIAEIIVTACTGLVRGETFRILLFLLPLLMLPIGLELRNWNTRATLTVYVCLWALLVVIGQNLVFNGWMFPDTPRTQPLPAAILPANPTAR